jgi:hypothetical protein
MSIQANALSRYVADTLEHDLAAGVVRSNDGYCLVEWQGTWWTVSITPSTREEAERVRDKAPQHRMTEII